MDKYTMREWVSELESIIDRKLKKWKKESRIENGEVVQIQWQFEQTHLVIDVFWHDHMETVKLHIKGPRTESNFLWHGLNPRTCNQVQDRVGNLVQMIMHPPVDLPDLHG